MAITVLAEKGKFKKRFPIESWELLGKDKNGWAVVESADQVVVNEVKPPDAGQKKKSSKNQIVENLAPKKVADQVVVNEVKQEAVEENKTDAPKATVEFIDLATKNLSIARIKDFFDSKEIEYKNSMKLADLIELLAVNLNNDIEAVKVQFNISGGNEL